MNNDKSSMNGNAFLNFAFVYLLLFCVFVKSSDAGRGAKRLEWKMRINLAQT